MSTWFVDIARRRPLFVTLLLLVTIGLIAYCGLGLIIDLADEQRGK